MGCITTAAHSKSGNVPAFTLVSRMSLGPRIDNKLRRIVEQATRPVERQYDGQEAAAALGSPPVADQSLPYSPRCTLFFSFRGLAFGANHIIQLGKKTP